MVENLNFPSLCIAFQRAEALLELPGIPRGQKHLGKNVQVCMLLGLAADTPTVRRPVNHGQQQQAAHGSGLRAAGGGRRARAGRRPAPLPRPGGAGGPGPGEKGNS